jgi:hypothetical protein
MSDVTRWCPKCDTRRPIELFGQHKTCSGCRTKRSRSAGQPVSLPDGYRKCFSCEAIKPISKFESRKSCSDCREYAREWNRRRHASDPGYRDKINARVRERSITEPDWRARRNAELRGNYVKANPTKPRIGDTLTATCLRCPTTFTYQRAGNRRRTLCDLCKKYNQEWHYYRLSGPEVEVLRSRTACDACGAAKSGGNGDMFRIDHCHETGVVRGVICHACNIIAGLAKDRAIHLRDIADYLERHRIKGSDALG